MANTNSNIATAHATAQTSGRSPLDSLDSGALPIFIRGRVTCPATPTVNDTLTLVPGELIPDGAAYAPALSWVYPVTDPGTALTLDVGPSSDPDALANDLALTTAGTTGGVVQFDECSTAPLAMTSRVRHVGGEDIVATVTVSTSVVATVIEFCIAYYANA
jgi:hypothetical protein